MTKTNNSDDPDRTLLEATKDLGSAYREWKSKDKETKKLRQEFFDLASESFSQDDLAHKIVVTPQFSGEDEAKEYAVSYNPGWRAIDITEAEDDGRFQVLIEEDPNYLPFSFVNPNDKFVYTRTIQSGSPVLDDERLQIDDPELWLDSTVPENLELICNVIEFTRNNVDSSDDDFDVVHEVQRFCDNYDAPRVLLPLEDLPAEQLKGIRPYLHEGPKVLKLNAPRKAKPDELV